MLPSVIGGPVGGVGFVKESYASFWHFFMKLFFAAPFSGFPSLPTAFGSQASFLHFCRKAFLAAPESGLPSLLTACVSHVLCASQSPQRATQLQLR
jgi:hypothetical protein